MIKSEPTNITLSPSLSSVFLLLRFRQDRETRIGQEGQELQPFIRTLQELTLRLRDPNRDLRLVQVCDLLIPGQLLRELFQDSVSGIALQREMIHGGLDVCEAVPFTGGEKHADLLLRDCPRDLQDLLRADLRIVWSQEELRSLEESDHTTEITTCDSNQSFQSLFLVTEQ